MCLYGFSVSSVSTGVCRSSQDPAVVVSVSMYVLCSVMLFEGVEEKRGFL